MLTVNQLTLTHRKDLTVLVDSLSFTLNDGERLALIGEEGNGKSTLLRCIGGRPVRRELYRGFRLILLSGQRGVSAAGASRIRADAQCLRFLLHVARLFRSISTRIGRTRRPSEPARRCLLQ